jgi:hypothetical protein
MFYPISLRSILILSSYLCPGLPNVMEYYFQNMAILFQGATVSSRSMEIWYLDPSSNLGVKISFPDYVYTCSVHKVNTYSRGCVHPCLVTPKLGSRCI